MNTLSTVSKLPVSTYIVATGKTRATGNSVEIFRGTLGEAVNKAQSNWPDADCTSVRDWLEVLICDYRSVEFEA